MVFCIFRQENYAKVDCLVIKVILTCCPALLQSKRWFPFSRGREQKPLELFILGLSTNKQMASGNEGKAFNVMQQSVSDRCVLVIAQHCNVYTHKL